MLNLTERSKIYIVTGARYVSGGTESLYQLNYNLKKCGYNVFMYYKPGNINDPIPAVYSKYKVAVAKTIVDSKDNILIVPEISTFMLYRYKYIQGVIFWLSVDNYYPWLNIMEHNWLKRLIKKVIGYNKFFLINDNTTHHKVIFHFSQSAYAINHLKNNGVFNVAYMPDYIHEDFMTQEVVFNSINRKNIIAYNPVKGFEFTQKLIEKITDIEWLPIVNLNIDQIKISLLSSKLYIDFGNHPGKDRIPREAALLGCCIITNKRGAAFFDEDIAIPDNYKFEEDDIDKIISCIKKCVFDYDHIIHDFELYRQFISNHTSVLENQIRKVFISK